MGHPGVIGMGEPAPIHTPNPPEGQGDAGREDARDGLAYLLETIRNTLRKMINYARGHFGKALAAGDDSFRLLLYPHFLSGRRDVKPDWFYLLLAACFEMCWPVGLKMAQGTGRALLGTGIAVVGIVFSGFFLFLAQRSIPLGTAYATWTGIGAAGTFCIGIAFYGDPANVGRILGVSCIILGVVTLKLS